MSSSSKDNRFLFLALAAVAAAGLAYVMMQESGTDSKETQEVKKLQDDDIPDAVSEKTTNDDETDQEPAKTPTTETTKKVIESNNLDEKALHSKIEELDKKGKAYFKNKQFLQAAQAFTEALDLIESQTDDIDTTSFKTTSLNKQIITLINNRSAMYEKGKLPELALEDCNKILEVYDMGHTKARLRKLRVLEGFQQYYPAVVEVCALQLLYMQQHRDTLRMGIPPAAQPPVQQSKLEDLINQVLPEQLEAYVKTSKADKDTLPSDYTLMQLLKSYTGYNAWMAKAAKDGSISTLKKQLEGLPSSDSPTSIADKASLMMKLGRRYVYDKDYSSARKILLEAYALVDGNMDAQNVMSDDDYARLLEWTGMVKHWTYDVQGASYCYKKCAELEPINAEILVKQAGVAMDGGKPEEAVELFDKALSIDPDAVDALLHRANLRMLQNNAEAAKADLQKCVKLRPNHIQAHLRLAAVLTGTNDTPGALRHLKLAEKIDPNSSEVQSYRGELCFTQNEFEKAKTLFEKAIKLEPKNPTPYVNAAVAILQTPPQPGQQMAFAQEACKLLEEAIKVDPQFQAAYVQLGQLKLGMATDLDSARSVVKLYDEGLTYCRTKDEMKDLCSMKLLTQAQVDAATALKMETFTFQ